MQAVRSPPAIRNSVFRSFTPPRAARAPAVARNLASTRFPWGRATSSRLPQAPAERRRELPEVVGWIVVVPREARIGRRLPVLRKLVRAEGDVPHHQHAAIICVSL